MKVHSRVRTPSARLSSLISLMTRNRRKKALEMRALSSGSCGPAAPEVSLEVAPQRGKEQAGWEGQCVCAGEMSMVERSSSPTSWPLLGTKCPILLRLRALGLLGQKEGRGPSSTLSPFSGQAAGTGPRAQ